MAKQRSNPTTEPAPGTSASDPANGAQDGGAPTASEHAQEAVPTGESAAASAVALELRSTDVPDPAAAPAPPADDPAPAGPLDTSFDLRRMGRPALRVSARPNIFWRDGRRFTREPSLVFLDDLSEAELGALLEEAMLDCAFIDADGLDAVTAKKATT